MFKNKIPTVCIVEGCVYSRHRKRCLETCLYVEFRKTSNGKFSYNLYYILTSP